MKRRGGFGKRAQFYLISAVILSAIVVSIATVKNYVHGVEEPREFFDISEQIKDESARVIDYGVLNPSTGGTPDIDSFSKDAIANYYGVDPNLDIIFVYGDTKNGVNITNYASERVCVGNTCIPGALEDVESNIELNVGSETFDKNTVADKRLFTNDWNKNVQITDPLKETVTITIYGQQYLFQLYEHQQFFMIIKKSIKGEDYVEVK